MAKYDVKHSCGHTQEHQLFGPGKERDRKIEWLESTVCCDCYKQARKAVGPMFLVRVVPGFDPAEAVARAAKCREEAARELASMEYDIRELRADIQEDVRAGRDLIHTCGGRDDSARAARNRARKAADAAASWDRDAAKPGRAAQVEISCYENSFDIKDQLKARGWKFSDSAPRPASGDLVKDMMYGMGKGWVWLGTPEKAAEEANWIEGQKWSLKTESRLATFFRSPIEGRPELAGLPE